VKDLAPAKFSRCFHVGNRIITMLTKTPVWLMSWMRKHSEGLNMNKNSRLARLVASVAGVAFVAIIACIANAAPASAQEFLNPVATPAQTAPNFLAPGAMPLEVPVVPTVQTSNNGGTIYGQPVTPPQYSTPNLPTMTNGLLAPNSVNMAPFPSGTNSYGFAQPTTSAVPNHYGNYASQQLPPTATSSVDINIVDCPNLASNYAAGQTNPWANNYNLSVQQPNGTWATINFQETANEAQSFMQSELQDATASFQ
jgi:hypothetical protein